MSIDFNRRFWNEKIETLSADEMGALQLKRLKKQVVYNYEHSLFYRKKFEEGGAKPGDIHDFEDFRCIPLTTKEQQRRSQEESIEQFGHPYSPLAITCAPLEKIVRINSTSGTTGIPTLYTLTQHDVDVVNEMHARKFWMAGIRPGHVILQCLSLSMFTGGLPLSQGIMNLGACAVPVGIDGGTKRALEFARLTGSDAIFATPSFGLYLIEQCSNLIGKEAAELGIKWFFTAGEAGGGNPDVRNRLSEGFGGAMIFDHTGGGHGFHGAMCYESPESYSGMHFMSGDHCLVELVDPGTKRNIEIENGVTGELVMTFLDWEGSPFMRYAYGDILQVLTTPCACGRTGMKFKIIGRADDMLIVKGVNIYPSSIKDAISHFYPRTTGVVKIVLDQPGPLIRPPLKIWVEYGAHVTLAELPFLKEEIGNYFRETFRVHPEIEWAPPHSIPQETGKTGKVKLVEIVRKEET
jgi:phenylacetate-CoA ligase